jgi:hypothetical protein
MDPNSVRYWVDKLSGEGGLVPKGDGALTAEIQRLRKENARLLMEREISKKRPLLCEGADVRFSFIQEHRGSFPVEMACHALEVSRPGYHAWRVAQERSYPAQGGIGCEG